MNICIPTAEEKGLDSEIHSHFGSAPLLALVDASTLAVEFLPRDGAKDASGACRPGATLSDRSVDMVLCHWMGRGALESMESLGIPVFVTEATTLGTALQSIMDGAVQRLDASRACPGHGHDNDTGHTCCSGN